MTKVPLTPALRSDLRTLREHADNLINSIDALTDDEDISGPVGSYLPWTMGSLTGAMNRVLAFWGTSLSYNHAEETPDLQAPVPDTSSLIAEAESLLATATKGPWSVGESHGAIVSTHAQPTGNELRLGYWDGYGGVMVCESVRRNNAPFLARSHSLVSELVEALKRAGQADA